MRAISIALLFVSLWAIAQAQEARDPEPRIPVVSEIRYGKCVSVSDGDTISVVIDKTLVTVRLEGIDAPEKGQDHGTKATQALAGFVKGKSVSVHVTGKDRYGRTLAIIRVDGRSVNEWLVEQGWAWQYTEYNSDPHLTELQAKAKENRLGLWAHENVVPPWEFRRLERQRQAIAKERADRSKSNLPSEEATTRQAVPQTQPAELRYWLNTSSNVRHNSSCRYFKNTKRGRECGPHDGKACGICGG